MKYIAGAFLALFFVSHDFEEECHYELDRIERQIVQIQIKLNKPIDDTPCHIFGIFGDMANKIGEEEGQRSANVISELMYGVGNLICAQKIKKRERTKQKLEQLQKRYMHLRVLCYEY